MPNSHVYSAEEITSAGDADQSLPAEEAMSDHEQEAVE